MPTATATATGQGFCLNTGGVTRAFWAGIVSGNLSALTGAVTYPNNPTSVDVLGLFETGTNIGNDYGQRVYGYVCPPTTGSYVFWVAADNVAQLYLSSSSNPASKALIVNLTNWAGPRDWNKYAIQKSITLTLQANTPYYIEALHKEGSGGDNFGVAWQGPGIAQQVIAGQYLVPFGSAALSTPTPGPTMTPSPTATATQMALPTATRTPTPTLTPTETQVPLPTHTPTATPTLGPTLMPTASPTLAPTLTPSPTPIVSNACANTGGVTRAYWAGLAGGAITSLTSSVNYPNNPTSVSVINTFETGTNIGNDYGQRIYGYVCPPTTGSYVFWVAADNVAQLYLSSNSNPALKVQIVNLTNWAGPRDWNKYAIQKSVTLTLQANTPYYIEALHKESTGGDNFAVAWQGPGITQQVISGTYLAP